MATAKAAKGRSGAGLWAKAGDFLKGVWSELKKVHWLNRKELASYTGMVILVVAIAGVAIFLVDSLLGYLVELAIGG